MLFSLVSPSDIRALRLCHVRTIFHAAAVAGVTTLLEEAVPLPSDNRPEHTSPKSLLGQNNIFTGLLWPMSFR